MGKNDRDIEDNLTLTERAWLDFLRAHNPENVP